VGSSEVGSFHPGELSVQERAGRRSRAVIGDKVPPVAAGFLAEQPLIVVAGRDEAGRVWITMLDGAPGFAEAPDERTIHVHRRPPVDDPLAHLAATGGQVGMIALDHDRRMRVNGELSPASDGFVIRTEQVFANCHKYISERHPTVVDQPPSEVRRGAVLTDRQIALVTSASTFFIGTAHPDGPADASHRGGNPGFVVVDDPSRLRWADYLGNGMYMTLGNIALDPRLGLLFVDWDTGGLLQLTGRARVDWTPTPDRRLPGGERLVEVEIDAVQETDHALGLRWDTAILSPFNPPLTVG
jgi:predicted pyridoxine 5'-phosphate oxidase superfamily flavin-nucleotide-binding protein